MFCQILWYSCDCDKLGKLWGEPDSGVPRAFNMILWLGVSPTPDIDWQFSVQFRLCIHYLSHLPLVTLIYIRSSFHSWLLVQEGYVVHHICTAAITAIYYG